MFAPFVVEMVGAPLGRSHLEQRLPKGLRSATCAVAVKFQRPVDIGYTRRYANADTAFPRLTVSRGTRQANRLLVGQCGAGGSSITARFPTLNVRLPGF
jgi:hypothetical protein